MEVLHLIIYSILAVFCLLSVIALVWAVMDKRKMEHSLYEADSKCTQATESLTAMLSKARAFVFILTEDHKLHFNERFYKLTQLRKRDIPLRVALRLVAEEDREKVLRAIYYYGEEIMNVDFSIRVPSKGTIRTLRVNITNMEKGGVGMCMGVMFPLDEISNETKKRTEALAIEEKTNIKASFLASMGHELRTPLNAIVGFSQIISQQYEYLTEEDRKGFCEIIQQNNEQLLNLLDSVSGAGDGNSDDVQIVLSHKRVADLMEELYLSHTVIVPKHLELRYVRGDEDDCIMANRGSMLQVVSNLMNNAIKFTKEGAITLGWESDADTVTIFVEDTGIGIKKENLNKLFDKFFKESSASNGAGFGLPLCQRLVHKMNGNINVKSELGKGSRFEVIFQKA